jgi:hypothetical protein
MNYCFRGVYVPAGKGVIQYDYQPASFRAGLAIAAASAAVLLGWLLASRMFLLWSNKTQ